MRRPLLLSLCLVVAASAAAQSGPAAPQTPPRILLGTPATRLQATHAQAHAAPADSSLPKAAKPEFSVTPGSYSGTQTVTITDSTPGAAIYYSTNGTYPVVADYNKYAGSITVSSSEIVVAVAAASGYSNSDWASAEYLITSVPSRFLYTVAGNDTWGYPADGEPGPVAMLASPAAAVADDAGNVYIADYDNNVILKVDGKTGIITTVAGTGVQSDTGDGGPATSATLWLPFYLALDESGNLYIAENGDYVVRKMNLSTGVITRFAGDPNGTGTPGTALGTGFSAGFIGLAVNSGEVYIGTGYAICGVDSDGKISEVAGYSTVQGFPYLQSFAIDGKLNIYGWEEGYGQIDKITAGGQISVYAGSKSPYSTGSGDGGPAIGAKLGVYGGYLATDPQGNLYISDTWDNAIREVNSQTGIINTVAGVYGDPYTVGADGDPATSSGLYSPQNLSVDASGNIYLGDASTLRVRKITAPATPPSTPAVAPVFSVTPGTLPDAKSLTISSSAPGAAIFVTFDGSDPTTNMQGYHGPIDVTASATLKAIAVAPGFLKSPFTSASYTVSAPLNHIISTLAGTGRSGQSGTGTGGPVSSTALGAPTSIAFDASGNSYISDRANNVVWKLNSSGTIAVVAGNGTYGSSGDGAAATSAQLASPTGVAVDKSGNLYIGDGVSVRVVSASTGIINTYAGGGKRTANFGDGGPATSAYLSGPIGLVFDTSGNLYIADSGDNRVRLVDAKTAIITTVAGGALYGSPIGDGGPATSAYLYPTALALDRQNNLYVVDAQDARVRRVDATTGIITTVAGGGNPGPDPDGSLATAINVTNFRGVAIDASGDLYYSDLQARVRKIDAATGTVTTVAGNTYYGYTGDGGEATMAQLGNPQQIAFDNGGNLYIPDSADYVVRRVTFPPPAATPAFSVAGGAYTSVQHVTLTDSTSGAAIYYTLDGTTPDTGSTTYSGPIAIRESATLQAVAAANGHALSAVAKAVYSITLQTPTLALSSSAATAYTGNPVTLTATLTVAAGSPTGTVTFMDGTTELGTGNVSGGTATYTTSSLAVGTHTITAVYSGDDGFNPATSADTTVNISDFTFAPPSGGTTSATVKPGGTATYQLTVTPPSGSTTLSAVTFSIAGLPAGATSSFNPSSVPANSGTTNVTLSVKVPAQSASVPAATPRFPLVLGLALLPLLGLGKARRASKTLLIVLAIGSAAALAVFTGCGGSGNSGGGGGGSQSQTYNLTVTTTAGSDSHTTKLTLTVQ
jgi:sugar lactone lactonase YvrE